MANGEDMVVVVDALGCGGRSCARECCMSDAVLLVSYHVVY